MTPESKQNNTSEPFAGAAASSLPGSKEDPAAAQYAPGSAQDRLAEMPLDKLKKTYRDARDLWIVMAFFAAVAVSVYPVSGGFGASILFVAMLVKNPKNFILLPFYLTAAISLVCLLPTFCSYRFTFAKWVIRIWMVALSVFAAIALVYAVSGWFFEVEDGRIVFSDLSWIIWKGLSRGGHMLFFSLGLFGMIFALRAFVLTFNPDLFGPARFTGYQIKHALEKRNAGLKPDGNIPPACRPGEPGSRQKLVTGIAAFGIVYLPPFIWWFISAFLKGLMFF